MYCQYRGIPVSCGPRGLNGGRDRLYRNNGNGTFSDVTQKLKIDPDSNYGLGVLWGDFNLDGCLDLYVADDSTPSMFYKGDCKGGLVESGLESGLAYSSDGHLQAGMGVDAADFDHSGSISIVKTNFSDDTNNLYHYDSNEQFTDEEAPSNFGPISYAFLGFGVKFFDYDNDGWPDIFVSGYWATMPNVVREYLGDKEHAKGDRPRLYHNNRDGTFTDVSQQAHLDSLLLTMGANFGDLDNDGWLDFYLGTGAAPLTNIVPHQMFRNNGGKYFQNVTTSGGFGHLQKGHAVAFGDIDHTGNQDVFEVIGGAFTSDRFYSAHFKNPGHGYHGIKLNLTGTKSNRFAVGGRIRLRVTEDGVTRDIYKTVNSGGSFGASSLRPHIGVGKATAVDEMEIRWPGSAPQTFKGPIAADQTYDVREGDSDLKVAAPPAFAPKQATR